MFFCREVLDLYSKLEPCVKVVAVVHKTTLTQVMKERSFSSDVVAKEVKFSDVYNVYLTPFQGLYFVFVIIYIHALTISKVFQFLLEVPGGSSFLFTRRRW